MVADRARYTNSTLFGDAFQPRRYIYPVAMNIVVARDDDVAQIDADTEHDPLILGRRRIALGHPTLDRDCADDSLYDARKFDKNAVAGGLDDAAFVVGDIRIDQLAAMRSEPCESADLVLAH